MTENRIDYFLSAIDYVEPHEDIVIYNETKTGAEIKRLFYIGRLIKPEFQREDVWNNDEKTRFIDSLVRNFPIPSMCFAYDYKQKKYLIVYGLQRTLTVHKFLDDTNWQLSKLSDINPLLSGRPTRHIIPEFFHNQPWEDESVDYPKDIIIPPDNSNPLHELYKIVEDFSFNISVIRFNGEDKTQTNFLHTVFARLNTTSKGLTNQEIRNCLIPCDFNNMLKELNRNKDWKSLNVFEIDSRQEFAEMILMIYAFIDNYQKLNLNMVTFLNDYLKAKKMLEKESEELQQKGKAFLRITEFLHSKNYLTKYSKLTKLGKVIWMASLIRFEILSYNIISCFKDNVDSIYYHKVTTNLENAFMKFVNQSIEIVVSENTQNIDRESLRKLISRLYEISDKLIEESRRVNDNK